MNEDNHATREQSDIFIKNMVIPSLVLVALVFLFFMGRFGGAPEVDEPVGDDGIDDIFEEVDEPEFETLTQDWEEGEEKVRTEALAVAEAPPESTRIESDRFQAFVEQFEAHYEAEPRRVLHVTIDRPMYRPGQTLNWRSWHRQVGDFSRHADDGDQVSVELLSPRDDVVEEETLEIREGRVRGDFVFDDEARGGEWTLRISDGDDEYERPVLVSHFEPPRFRQVIDFDRRAYRPGETVEAEIEILRDTGEPLRGHEVTGYLQLGGEHVADIEARLDGLGQATIAVDLPGQIASDDAAFVLTLEEGGMTETEIFPVPLALEDVVIDFQPEGGELVQGLTSRVYFEARDLSGEPVDVEGVIVDSTGGVQAEVNTEHRGRGRFEFTPQQGEDYELALSDSSDVGQRFELPQANSQGCVLRVYDDFDAQADAVRTAVWCSEGRLVGIAGVMADEILDVAIMTAGPDEPAVAHLAPESDWPRPAGTVRVSVFREDAPFEPVAERVTFRGRRAQLEIDIQMDQEVYHPGETVELEFKVSGFGDIPAVAELAKAVVDERVHARAHHEVPSIVAQLLLKSDDLHFWGDVEEANEYFDLYEDQAAVGLDLLMGVRGWRSDDERDGFYVDGGDEKIEAPPLEVVHRRPPQPRLQPQRQVRRRAQVEDLGRMEAGGAVGGFGGGGAAEFEPPQEPMAAPAPAADLDGPARSRGRQAAETTRDFELAEAATEAEDSEGAPGSTRPFWARDDDAAAFSAFEPVLTTGSDGRVTASFELPEAIGAYRISVDAIDDYGMVGSADELVRIEVPLSVALRMPEIMSGQDQLLLPATVRNTTTSPLDVALEVSTEGPVAVADSREVFEVSVPPRTTATQYVPIVVDDARGEGLIRVQARGGGFIDGAERSFEIEPRGYDRNALLSGQLPGEDRHDSPLRGMTEAGASADLVIYPSPAAEALEGVESMSRRPVGCFEQASGSNHPNVLAWQYLSAGGQLEGETEAMLKRHIESGYQLLLGYEIEGGGFEWFGRPPAQAALTAWGLVQFTAMQEIVDDFDDRILDRSVAFLRTLQADDGSWDSGHRQAWQRISPSDRTPAELLVIFGLARVGQTEGFEVQLSQAAQVAQQSDDIYEVALATAALASADYDPGAVEQGMERLIAWQRGDGSWAPEGGRSWTWGYGNSFNVETTGLATLALIEGGGPQAAISEAIDWLGTQKTARSWWGSTQATVMALESRIAYEREGLDVTDGVVSLEIDGASVAEVEVVSGDTEPVRISDIGQYLSEDTDAITLRSEVPVEYDLELDWRVEQFDVDDGGPLSVEFQVGDGQNATMGDEVPIRLEVRNQESNRLGMVIARVALPAGVEVTDRELEALVERSDVDLYETTGRDVILYFEDMEADEETSLRFSATAAVPGLFDVPASVVYPYYRDESQWQWGQRSVFRVATP